MVMSETTTLTWRKKRYETDTNPLSFRISTEYLIPPAFFHPFSIALMLLRVTGCLESNTVI